MSHGDAEQLDRQLDRLIDELPRGARGFLHWLREPRARWVRIPIGLILIVAGIVGFLPLLGFWMVPLGLLLMAQDVPFLRRPTARGLLWLERKWAQWKGRDTSSGGGR
jgi:hypothetical protein